MPIAWTASPLPPRIPDHEIERELSRDNTYLGLDPRGRRVVLKRLPDDCILSGKLHPEVEQRLARVREIPDIDIATLHGVVRGVERGVWLVWDFVPGQTLDEAARSASSPRQCRRLLRDSIVAIESLHARGLVHGAIHARNICLDETGHLRLTHISPLLYEDVRDDELATLAMLSRITESVGNAELGEMVAAAQSRQRPLAWLRTELASAAAKVVEEESPNESPVRLVRRRAMLLAIAAALAALILTASLWFAFSSGRDHLPKPVRAGELAR